MASRRPAAWAILLSLTFAASSGCGTDRGGASAGPKGAKPLLGVEIEVVAIGDAGLRDLVDAQRSEWEQSRGARAKIRAESKPDGGGADVLIFPGDLLGALVDTGALAVIPDAFVKPPPPPKDEETPAPPPADPLDFKQVAPPFRELVTKYGADRIGLPLGGSALVVVYRRDAFAEEATRKAAAEAGIKLAPPETWEQFDALAKFLHNRDWDGDGAPESGVALALGTDPDGVGDAILVARAAAMGQHPDQYSFLFDSETLEPRIAGPPFVAALEGLVALKSAGPPGMTAFDADAARAAFRSGSVAMLIDRAERSARWTEAKAPLAIGIAPMPGSGKLYDSGRKAWDEVSPPNVAPYLPRGGGWLVGVSARSTGPKRDAALDFVAYLAGTETSSRLLGDRALPMLPIRSSQVASGPPDPRSAPGIDPRRWSEAISKTWLSPRTAPGLRIPGAEGYLADLSTARVAASDGASASEALAKAAAAWSERSKGLGVPRQLWHYRRSLNRLTTEPEPPGR